MATTASGLDPDPAYLNQGPISRPCGGAFLPFTAQGGRRGRRPADGNESLVARNIRGPKPGRSRVLVLSNSRGGDELDYGAGWSTPHGTSTQNGRRRLRPALAMPLNEPAGLRWEAHDEKLRSGNDPAVV